MQMLHPSYPSNDRLSASDADYTTDDASIIRDVNPLSHPSLTLS